MKTKSKKKTKPVIGRPTKYEPKYCKMLITHMAKGYSFESFGGTIDIATSTVSLWANGSKTVTPVREFSVAKKLAFDKSRVFWERQGLEGLWAEEGDRKINPTIWIFNMKNRFGWRDKVENTTEVQLKPYIIKKRNGDEVELGMKEEDGEGDDN
tara:strand:- start:369 stop:830 length:462 start_codon:yes stop_codon:yes gene_type:complete